MEVEVRYHDLVTHGLYAESVFLPSLVLQILSDLTGKYYNTMPYIQMLEVCLLMYNGLDCRREKKENVTESS